jgi:hypothetical protein
VRIDTLVLLDALHAAGKLTDDERDKAVAFVMSVPDYMPVDDGGTSYMRWRSNPSSHGRWST